MNEDAIREALTAHNVDLDVYLDYVTSMYDWSDDDGVVVHGGDDRYTR